jgi:hypothetical protein
MCEDAAQYRGIGQEREHYHGGAAALAGEGIDVEDAAQQLAHRKNEGHFALRAR